jgi:nucleoside-diphosphate-sugar epimerase
MQIALTGATGFVGAHTARELISYGHDVRLLVRDAGRLTPELAQGAQIVEGSLEDATALSGLVQDADAVIHVAGAIKAANLHGFMAANAHGAARLAAAAVQAGVSRFVHVSSLAAREPQLSGYCASKAAGEVAVRTAADAAPGMALTIIRPPAVYGPGDRATLPLADLAAALVAAAEGAGRSGACYEIDDGTPGGYSHAAMAEAAGQVTGRVSRVAHLPRALLTLTGAGAEGLMSVTGRAVILSRGKVRELYHDDWVCTGEKFEHAGPWRARYRFAEGYADTLRWYRINGWLPAR